MKKILCTLVLSSLFISCSSSEIVPNDNGNDNGTETTIKTTYNKDVKTIINNSCATASCHDSTAPTAGLSLTNYTQVKNSAENGNLITRMNNTTNPMPPTGILSSSSRAIVDKWKADGYLEN